MNLKIKEVNSYVVDVPLKNEWQISLYSAKTRHHAIVEIITEEGHHGYGEASPSPAFMGETGDTVKFVVDNYLAEVLEGKLITNIVEIHDAMDKSIYGNTSAKSAVDIAIYDALGKAWGVPVYQLLGGKYREEIPLTYVVGIKDKESAYEEAIKNIKKGFKGIKIKVGKEPNRDIELVKTIQRAIKDSGKNIKLRLDANQGYDPATAIKVIKEMENNGELESVEQPTIKTDYLGIKKIKNKVKTPIMLDETIFNPKEAMNAIRLDIADSMNIKVCKVGGLFEAKKIANMAEVAGMKCTVGSNLELGLGIAASLHFVLSTPVINMPSDFICGVYLHQNDILKNSIDEMVKDGKLISINKPGLGVELNKKLIE